MGFLKNFFEDVFSEDRPRVATPTQEPPHGLPRAFDRELEAHLNISRYGDFELTDAIRPALDLAVVPTAGYRHDVYRDQENKCEVPVLMASVSKPQLIETFMNLIQPLGLAVDVVLETSHGHHTGRHTDLYRERIDMPILESILWDFEDLLTNDGCTGIAVLNPTSPQEVQLDEHKLLIVYGSKIADYEQVFIDEGVPCRDDMRFLTEAEHIHSSHDRYVEQFERLKTRLGIDSDL